MSGSAARRQAIEAVTRCTIPGKDVSEPLGAHSGKDVFRPSAMKSRLPKNVFKSVLATIEQAARVLRLFGHTDRHRGLVRGR